MPDDTRSDDAGFAAMWSSDGATRSFSPSDTGTGLPADLPFLFSPGQRFGPYLIVRPLGKGGMGQVYEAEETDSGRRVAMKILPSLGMGLLVAGAVWTALHPSRSIQDRLAGTWIVPR